MQNTRLVRLLKTFDSSEFKQFRDFINSPYYNRNKNVISLYSFLKKFYPDFTGDELNDESAFRKLFPDEKYDYFKLKNIISDLLSLGRKFLATSHFHNKTDLGTDFLLEEFRDRNLRNMHEQLFSSSLKKLNESVIRDEIYFLKQFELAAELKNYYSPIYPNSHFNLFQDQLNYFIKYSLVKMLRLYNTMLHENKQNNYEFDFRMFDEIFSYLKNNLNEQDTVILLYYNIILLEKENDEKYFFTLKELFGKHSDELSHYDRYMYFLHMSGFCADRFNNQCKTDFTREHFLLSKENFELGTIELGKILYLDFLNHVKIAVRVDEFEWAEKYICRFKDSLSDEHRQSSLNFCYGYIDFKKRNFENALNLLSQVNFSNFIIKIQVKNLLLQTYYELGLYEQALAMIDTFRHYLSRDKNLPDNYKFSFNEYFKNITDIIRYITGSGINSRNIITKDFKSAASGIKCNPFGIKLWLIEKINEL
ncbi:MAG: hypothetical protein JNJ56_02920 [Ignavibacteria bacterium]|nr:hypothetical protein [Ignavibacteria bacterium]